MSFKQAKKSDSTQSNSVSKNDTKNQSHQAGESVNKSPASKQVDWLLKDSVVLAAIGLSFYLFLILYSYHPTDPGFDGVQDGLKVLNYGGATGAWLASAILYLFGLFGFVLPFGILYAGVVTLKLRAGSDIDFLRFWLSLSGLMLLALAGSGLASLFFEPKSEWIQLPYSGGGVLGYEVSQMLVSAVDLLGTTLLFIFVFAIGFSLLTSYSWLTIMDYTGLATWYVLSKVRGAGKQAQTKMVTGYQQKQQAKLALQSNETTVKASPVILSSGTDTQSAQTAEHTKKKVRVIDVLAEKVKEKTQSKQKDQAESQAESESENDNAPKASSGTQTVQSSVKIGQKETLNTALPKIQSGELPSVELLAEIPEYDEGFSEEELKELSELLETRLKEFGVSVKVEAVQPGPVVTRFEVLPAAGVKVSQINNLSKDLARVLSVKSVRVVDIIPGKSVVGIEIPNEEREIVSFREVISSDAFQNAKSPLTVALGKDIAGKAVVADIAKMPHLLVAGTTGAGKSVGVNSMILSLLYKATPEEVRLIMVDPKMLELSIYEDIPHLLTPVVTDMSEAANALRWCVFEMDRRYQLMAKLGVRNIAGFNAKVKGAIEAGEPILDPLYVQAASFGMDLGETPPTLEPLPFIVVVVDEFADMIMVVGKEVEQLIARIAQKARAAGIHLILATQRPSVNVITGLIKANIPTRISFMVNTKIDSRTILDQGGAEALLGMGDMLFMPPGSGAPKRVHGAFMSDDEVHAVASFVKSQGEPQYLEAITKGNAGNDADTSDSSKDAEQDPLYDEIVAFVAESRRVSVSLVQRQFSIGYNRSARIVEAMEAAGIVSASKSNGNRDVLIAKPE